MMCHVHDERRRGVRQAMTVRVRDYTNKKDPPVTRVQVTLDLEDVPSVYAVVKGSNGAAGDLAEGLRKYMPRKAKK